ncbi:metaphase-anaphase transition (Mlo2) [Pyrenophora seminiperda CCB06]|uniref:Metaphase-anaphase transition (Mlo2) n=1 Tax=Pyrenophora seminiperda CCB06 TaxID=1302712 RepID=A0A3M7MGQ4_9PLEO|nr:metaphase-anaphase transition (Mlo2) [Pyrenophora seminiperda CCB06]
MTPCTLRINAEIGRKGDVTGEEPAKTNEYNQNFTNKFCGCGQDYDPDQERGTMFQCLGLGSCDKGGCGEDWWHPECLIGFTREEFSKMIEKPKAEESNGATDAMDIEKPTTEPTKFEANSEAMAPPAQTDITAAVRIDSGVDGNDVAADDAEMEDDDPPLPPGFPAEEDFDHFICYKCVAANPWIKKYAGSTGFLPPIYHSTAWAVAQAAKPANSGPEHTTSDSKKRKATDEAEDEQTPSTLSAPTPVKRQKSEDPSGTLISIPETTTPTPDAPKHASLPPLPPTSPHNPLLPLPQTRLPRPPLPLQHLLPAPQTAHPAPRRRRNLRAPRLSRR